jgi:hypothetical protein
MQDGSTVTGAEPLRLPAVLDASQQQALSLAASGLTGLATLLQAVAANRDGDAMPADALRQTATAADALIAGGRAYLDALVVRQGWARGGLDPAAPLQSLLLGLQAMGPERVEDFCSLELPWALATALAEVPPAWAAKLLQLVSSDLQDKVVILLGVMTQADAGGAPPTLSAPALLALLRALPPAAAERITCSIEQLVPALSEALYQAVCDGALLMRLDDATLQRLIPRLPHREWGLLLKYAPTMLRERVFRNVTRRVARMLQDEIDMTRPGGLVSLVAVQHRLQAAIEELKA